jgi:hypothetical protein
MSFKKGHFEKGQLVKWSCHYFGTLRKAGCTEKSMKPDREEILKVVEHPAKHGSPNSYGVSPIDDENTIIACTKKCIRDLTNNEKNMVNLNKSKEK